MTPSHQNLVPPQNPLLPLGRHQSLGPLHPQSPQNLSCPRPHLAVVVRLAVVAPLAPLVALVVVVLLAVVASLVVEVQVAAVVVEAPPEQSLGPLHLQSPQTVSHPRPKQGLLAAPTGCTPARG